LARTTFVGPVGIGTGEGTTAPTGGTIMAPTAAGTDTAGVALTIQGGKGTGSGAGGAINFQVAPAGSTGTTAGTPATAMSIASTGLATFGATATAGQPMLVRTAAIAVTAATNTDITLTMPKSKIITLIVFTSTAFGAATDATLQIGSTSTGSEYVAAVSIKAAGKVALTFATALAAYPTITEGATLYLRVVQSGTLSATGAATLVVEYIAQA
jgi:hypothetical protein